MCLQYLHDILTNPLLISAKVNVLSDSSASIESIETHRRKLEDDILIGGESRNIATSGMLEMQPTERYKAISLQAVDKVAER
jgi:hypothetical protein